MKGTPRLWVVTEKAGRLLWRQISEVCGGRTRTVLILRLRFRKVPTEMDELVTSELAGPCSADSPCGAAQSPSSACVGGCSELKAPCLPQGQPRLRAAFLSPPICPCSTLLALCSAPSFAGEGCCPSSAIPGKDCRCSLFTNPLCDVL